MRVARLAVRALPLLFVGCFLDWTLPTGTTAADAGAEAEAAAPVDGAPGVPDDATARDATVKPPADGSCRSNVDCTADELCTWSNFGCGADQTSLGTCSSRKADCGNTDPNAAGIYCGCNGATFASACAALAEGVDLAVCKGDSGGTVLGYATCKGVLVDDPSLPRERRYRCAGASNCTANDCGCLQKTFCATPGNGKCEGPIVHCG